MTEQTSQTRLQAERGKHQWTQAEVAEKLGVGAKTFGRWERGEQIAIPFMMRKLSELFGEKVDRSWFLRSGVPEAIPALLWYVPYDHNSYFTDEGERVEGLRVRLASEGKESSHVAISGPGGIGKTQLALEYAHRYRDFYKAVFWARAGTQAQLLEDLAGIAHLLQLPETKKRDEKQQYLVNQIRHWLQTHDGWLLIFDNAEEDLDNKDFSIIQLLATLKSGHVLLTTRVQSIANLAPNVLLDTMSLEGGAQFLLHRSHHLLLSHSLQMAEAVQRENALALSRLLDGLPLALEQAAAYIQETGCGLADYQQLYETSRKDVLQTKVTYKRLYTDYSESVATTWLISFRRVEQQSAIASDLLKLFAYLAPDALPTSLILKGAEKLDTDLRSLADNAHLLNLACQILLKYSLIKRFAKGTMLSIHRLIQAVLQDNMENDRQRVWAERAVQVVEWGLTATSVKEIKQYLPHARHCATLIKKHALQGQEATHLLEMTAKTVYQQGWYAQARPLYLHAYNAATTLRGEKDPSVLSLLLDVARVHMDLGASSLAVSIYQKVKEDLEQLFGAGDPEVIRCLNNVAAAQIRAGALPVAWQACKEALSRYTQGSASDTRQFAITCSIAAQIFQIVGRADDAELYYKRALEIRKQAFGMDHLEVASVKADRIASRLKLAAQGQRTQKNNGNRTPTSKRRQSRAERRCLSADQQTPVESAPTAGRAASDGPERLV